MVRRAGRLADDHANAVYVDRLRRELVMDVFDLDEAVIDRYKAFARSFTDIRSPELSAKVDELYATRHFWPEPLIQLNLHYADGGSIQDFIDAGDLEPEYAEVFRGVPDSAAGRHADGQRLPPVSQDLAAIPSIDVQHRSTPISFATNNTSQFLQIVWVGMLGQSEL